MKDWLIRFKARPWVAHLLRAGARFTERLGSQFGAAITYFSVLAIVPILMLAFSITGFVLIELRPGRLDDLIRAVTRAIGSSDTSTRQGLAALVANALQNYTAIGVIGLVSAAYSGAGWMGNLRNAVRAQWRANFDEAEPKRNIAIATLLNLLTLLGLLVLVAITFGLAAVSTSLADAIVHWLGLDDLRWLAPLLRAVPVIFSIGAGWVLFMYLYAVLPSGHKPWRAVRRGSLLGAVGLGILQYLTSFLVDRFGGNPAGAIFGPVITLMLFLNLFAQLILFIAAWIVTAPGPDTGPDDALAERMRVAVAEAADEQRKPPEPEPVPQHVAARSVRIGLGAGYVTGAATGIGLGALIGWVTSAVGYRRRSRE